MEFLGFLLYTCFYCSIAIVGVFGSILLAIVVMELLDGHSIADQVRAVIDRF